MTMLSLCERFAIDAGEIQTRHAFLDFSVGDEENLERIHDVLLDEVEGVVREFYVHLKKFGNVRRYIGNATHLHHTLRQYLLSLGLKREGLAYWETRLRIGTAHERIGLPQKWYLGAYAKLFALIRNRLATRYASDAAALARMLETLQKTFTLDAVLAVETYHQASVQTLEQALRDLTVAQRALQEASRTDGLTGVRNRVYLMEGLSREFSRSRRYRRAFTVVFLDLDHFKRVNDRYGHACGDAVLRKTGEVLARELRAEDLCGRFGGEEFLVGLVETNAATGKKTAERICRAIEQMGLEANGKPLAMTISAGVATLSSRVGSVEQLIRRADRALYRAKAAGRNQVRGFGARKARIGGGHHDVAAVRSGVAPTIERVYSEMGVRR